jgi:hypothetical protein
VATQGPQEDDPSPWSAGPRLQRLPGEHPEPPPASDHGTLPSPRAVVKTTLVRCAIPPSLFWFKCCSNPCTVARERPNSNDAPANRRHYFVPPHRQRPKPPSVPELSIREWTSHIAYPFGCVIGPPWTSGPSPQARSTTASPPCQRRVSTPSKSGRATRRRLS